MLLRWCTVVFHIYSPFWNLSASWKCWGEGSYLQGLTFYLANTLFLPVPCLDVIVGTLYYRPIEAGLTLVCLCFQSRTQETWVLFGQDQLTYVGHSVDGNVFQELRGLSFQCAVALTPFTNTLVIDSKFLSCSVNAGFVLALPLHHRDLELDSVGVLMKSYLNIMLLFLYHSHIWLGGLCAR